MLLWNISSRRSITILKSEKTIHFFIWKFRKRIIVIVVNINFCFQYGCSIFLQLHWLLPARFPNIISSGYYHHSYQSKILSKIVSVSHLNIILDSNRFCNTLLNVLLEIFKILTLSSFKIIMGNIKEVVCFEGTFKGLSDLLLLNSLNFNPACLDMTWHCLLAHHLAQIKNAWRRGIKLAILWLFP